MERRGMVRIALGEFTLDPADERLWGPNGQVRLGNKAFMLLSRLIEEQGRLVTKDALFSSVWDGTIVSESALTSVVKELRRALGDDSKEPRFIQSVYGRGYRLLEPARKVEGSESERIPGPDGAPPLGATANDGPEPYPPLLYVPAFDAEQIRDTQRWLDEVIREEVLLALSRFRDLRLVSDSAEKKAPSPSRAHGKRDYQLSVRLLNDGTAIRIFARIVRLETQEIVWADRERFDPEKPGQDTDLLVRKIVAAALPRVYEDVTRHLPVHTEDAYGIYLQNKLAMRASDSLEEMQAIAGKWEALLASHPGFAPAYPPLIYLYNTDYGYTGLGITTKTERRRAYGLARKASRLDPAEPYLHTVAAWCHLWAGEAGSARDHLGQALELNPFQKDRLLEVATAFMFLGDLDQAAELLARCETLTPFATEAPHEETGLLHLLLGRYEEAIECLSRIAQPTTSSQLYILLAAGASGAPDFPERVRKWAEQVQRRWRGSSEPDAEALTDWVLYHHPFQDEALREWILRLLRDALNPALPAPARIRRRALRTGSSAPSAVPHAS